MKVNATEASRRIKIILRHSWNEYFGEIFDFFFYFTGEEERSCARPFLYIPFLVAFIL